MLEIGSAQREITAFIDGVGMLGYGMHFNVMHDIETPLLARAYYFRDLETGKSACIVVADMGFVTISIKHGVLKKLSRKFPELDLNEANLLLSAQHTHSGPGGFSHYGFYNITIPGFVPQIYQTIVNGLVDAIVAAYQSRKLGTMHFDSDQFAPEIPVAFNRSVKAYQSNPEIPSHPPIAPNLALDRTMRMLRMDGTDGSKIGAINWFGVHTTSVHNDNHSLCWDNKGYAADFLENAIRKDSQSNDFVGAFAQGPAGDISPNYIWDKKKKWTRGAFENDFESARENGRLQFELAHSLFQKCENGHKVEGGIDYAHIHVNFSNVQSDPEFCNGRTDARTGLACHGLAFLGGTVEGPGMPKGVQMVAKAMVKLVKLYEFATLPFRKKQNRLELRHKYRVQGKKNIMIEAGARRMLGTSHIKKLVIPGFADPTIRNFKVLHPKGWQEDKPWIPHVLPLQILVLGDLAFVAIPAEPTTIAARRIKEVIETILKPKGIHEVIIAPYANAYCGYITTHEEYQVQAYEGGHTVFGEWTLAAFQTKFKELATELVKKSDSRAFSDDVRPPKFSKEELGRRSYPAI